MQFNWPIISKKIYGILKGSCDNLVMYDAKGNETIDPDDATRFFAAFKSSDPKLDNFTILIAIHDEGNRSHIDIKTPELDDDADFNKVNSIRTGIRRSIGEREGIKINWQVFDHAIDPREEAMHNIKESKKQIDDISESKDISKTYGSTKSSFQNIGNAKLIARHSVSVNEEKHGARSRNIKALFVENKDGERFRYPHLHMAGARAFARHISNGGTNHDDVSNKLFSISENYLHLRRSGTKLRTVEGIDSTWIPAIRESMNKINKQLKSMHGPKGYASSLTSILEENSIEDVSSINELYSQIMEKCGFDTESPYAKDMEIAAKYITERRLDPKPINFSWNSKPDIMRKLNEFAKVSERLTWQLNELAAACTDQTAMAKLASIAEMISNGVLPNADDMGIIKQAFESHNSYIHEEKIIDEEQELNEFLDDFTVESTFKEIDEMDNFTIEDAEVVSENNDVNAGRYIRRAHWNFTHGMDKEDVVDEIRKEMERDHLTPDVYNKILQHINATVNESAEDGFNDGFGPYYHAERLYRKECGKNDARLDDLPDEKQDEYINRILNNDVSEDSNDQDIEMDMNDMETTDYQDSITNGTKFSENHTDEHTDADQIIEEIEKAKCKSCGSTFNKESASQIHCQDCIDERTDVNETEIDLSIERIKQLSGI